MAEYVDFDNYDWDSITIADNHMFVSVFSDPVLCKELLERILRIEIDHVEIVNAEQSFVPEFGSRGIRMDVYAADERGTVYDVEMQKKNRDNLVKRARYYLSANDMDCIKKGEDYQKIRDSFVIFICLFDPIGFGLPLYTITNHCDENGAMVPDGTTRVFVNATAWEKCNDERLRPFLKYLMDNTIEDDQFCQDVDAAVREMRGRTEWRRNHMKWECVLMDERREGKAEGLAEGKAEGLAEGASLRDQQLAALRQKLQRDGRELELLDALDNHERIEALLREYGIGNGVPA